MDRSAINGASPTPGRPRARGTTTLVAGTSALVMGALLGLVGPPANMAGLWIGGLVGVVLGAVVLAAGALRRFSRGRPGYSGPLWHAVLLGAAVPLVVGVMLEAIAATAG